MVTESLLLRPWTIVIAVVLLAVAVVLGYATRRGPRTPSDVRWVANSSYLTELPSFRARMVQYRAGLAALVLVALTGGVAAGVLLARPVDRSTENSELATRDIVLCLDVSGSMIGYDVEIVDRFLQLVDSFDGERIALAIWNQTTRTVFPLTDDYTLVKEELTAARDALDFDVDSLDNGSYDPGKLDRLLKFITGTEGGSDTSTSLIGDGLVSCGLLFDEADTERSRSIILAGDNELIGTPIFTLTEAADFVTERQIGLVGIYSGASTATSSQEKKEFREVVTTHDGLYFEANDPAAVDAIIDRIQSQQAVDLDATPEVVITDRPAAALAVLACAFAVLLLVAWRLKE
ncbi:Ca-activated chloride channel family protein [Salana multivorans]|uniref:Ca-activated chloride channel family protein n=1 Tax=Salana multivorans TaxID=120377 RepID=A0A3N2DA54_9MICO|nr:hypothetical protein [Salana multivorans]ROR96508.1 Ca-activated chloride channel family protein [Salana multivorans]